MSMLDFDDIEKQTDEVVMKTPHPRQDPIPDPRRPASPRPGRAPGALPTFTTGSR